VGDTEAEALSAAADAKFADGECRSNVSRGPARSNKKLPEACRVASGAPHRSQHREALDTLRSVSRDDPLLPKGRAALAARRRKFDP